MIGSTIIICILIAIVYLMVFGIAFAIWLLCKIFRMRTPIQNAFLLWLCFPPKFYKCKFVQQIGKLPRILLTFIAPFSILILLLMFELASFLLGNPAPINHYRICRMIENESDVDYPSFKIVDVRFVNILAGDEDIVLEIKEGLDSTAIQELEKSEKWKKTIGNDGSCSYTIEHIIEYGEGAIEYKESVTFDPSSRKGTYQYRNYSFDPHL